MLTIGRTIAPNKTSEALRQTINKFDVFFRDCLVAMNEAIKAMFVVIIIGEYAKRTPPLSFIYEGVSNW